MFDLRNKIKIYVGNGEVRYGPRVEPGFFPVFSVKDSDKAKLLIETLPWTDADSLQTYSRKLESMADHALSSDGDSYLAKLKVQQEVKALQDKIVELGNKLKCQGNSYLQLQRPESRTWNYDELRAEFQENLDKLEVLVAENQQPSPIAIAIMGVNDEEA